MRMNKPNTHLYGWTTGNQVFIWNLNDSVARTFKATDSVLTIEMSDNAKYLAVIYKNSTGEIFTADGNQKFSFKTTINHIMNDRLVRFFPTGKYFMAAVNGNQTQIYDSSGICLYNLEGQQGSVNSLDISTDGRFVVTASSDKMAFIWNFNQKTGKFSPYDTITAHRDTVWSCEFNKTGKYILTASADSMLIISELNGSPRNLIYWYATNNRRGVSYNYEGHHNVRDSSLKSLNIYDKPVCNASFAADERAIIASNYSYNKNIRNFSSLFRVQLIYFGRSANDNYYMVDPFFMKAKKDNIRIQPHKYLLWAINSDRLIFAAFPNQNHNILLMAVNGYQLLEISGNFPCFSRDGQSLYYVAGKTIRMLPLDPEKIDALVTEKRLFGDPEKGYQPWTLL